MKKKYTAPEAYLGKPEIFADLFNQFLYGEPVLSPEKLQDLDIRKVTGGINFRKKCGQVLDALKLLGAKQQDGKGYVLLSIDVQHYSLPVFCWSQALFAQRTDRLMPVVPLILFLSPEGWDGPRRLHDMFADDCPAPVLDHVQDYKLNLLAPSEMSDEDLDKHETEVGAVLKYIKHSADKTALAKLVSEDEHFKRLSKDAARLLNAVAGANLSIDENKEFVDISQAAT